MEKISEQQSCKIYNFAFVGRPNVGKSSIFNAVIRKNEALVRNEEGTTIDWREMQIGNISIWDTPGVWTIEKMPLVELDKVFFVVENNILESDKKIYQQLKKKYDVIVLINKIDQGEEIYEYFDNFIKVSTKNGTGINKVRDIIFENFEDLEEEKHKLWAIIGRPNVGKSSLVNLFAQEERHKVEDCENTTRECIPVSLDDSFLLDTPGQRKRAIFPRYNKIFGLLLLIDEKVEKQDLRLVDLALKRHKPIILVLNKIDLSESKKIKNIEDFFNNLWQLPIMKISCTKNSGIEKLKEKMRFVEKRFFARETTSALNQWLTTEIRPIEPKIKFITQIEVAPPRFFVDQQLSDHKEKMLKKRLMKAFSFEGIPIQIKYKQPQKT